MFTVCPKCALTLVVTAADLRVAQGYVRCGRCSNVFNALARLSEDRNAAAAAAASQGVPPSSTGVHPRPQPTAVPAPPSQPPQTPARPPLATGSFTYTRPPECSAPPARAPQPQQPPAAPTRAPLGAAPSAHASTGTAVASSTCPRAAVRGTSAATAASGAAASVPASHRRCKLTMTTPSRKTRWSSMPTPDVNQVFVEPPPNPEWTAATGQLQGDRPKERGSVPRRRPHLDGHTSEQPNGSESRPPARINVTRRAGTGLNGIEQRLRRRRIRARCRFPFLDNRDAQTQGGPG